MRDQLDQRSPLTVLAAPHGYGKSVAMVGWLRDTFEDADLVLRVDLTAGRSPDDVWSEILRWFTGEPVPDSTTALASFDAWLRTCDEPVTLAIDSSHLLLDDVFLHQVVDLLGAHTRLFTLLAARQLPTTFVDIAHRVDTVAISQRDLAFRADDSLALLAAYAVDVGRERGLAIHESVQGWPTLIHRAAIGISGFSSANDGGRSTWPLGAEGVLPSLRLAARTYVLERMLPEMLTPDQISLAGRCALAGTVDSCAVDLLGGGETGSEAGGMASEAGRVASAAADTVEQQLQALARAGVLNSREELDRVVWTMSDLLADSLRASAAEELSADAIDALQRRFLEHFISHEQWPEAMAVALRLDDPQVIADVIADGWIGLAIVHESMLREAVSRLPRDVFAAHPVAAHVRAFLETPGGEIDHDELPDDQHSLAELAASDQAPTLLIDHLTFMLGLRTNGRIEDAVTTAGRLVRLLELTVAAQPHEVEHFVPAIHSQVAVTAQLADDTEGAAEMFRSALAVGERDPSQLAIPGAESGLALIAAIDGRVHTARDWVERARQHPPHPGWLGRRLLTPRLLAEAWLALDRLDKETIDPLMGQLVAQADDDELWGHIVEVRAMYDLLWQDSWSAIDDLQAMRRRRGTQAPPGSHAANALTFALFDHQLFLGQGTRAHQTLRLAPPDHVGTALRRATIALMAGRPEDVLAEPFSQQRISIRRRIHIDLLRASAQLELGDLAAASSSAGHALRQVRVYGACTPLAYLPDSRLAMLLEKTDLGDEDRRSLELAVELVPPRLASRVDLVELTEREQAVLKGLEFGLSSAQMAAADFVSVNTIKSQIRTLYRKLRASNREGALDRARRLGLMADPLD